MESWEAEQDMEGLYLMLRVKSVTWNRKGQPLDSGTPSLYLQRALELPRVPHFSGHEAVQL